MANTAADVMRIAIAEIGYSRWDDPQPGTKYGRWYADYVHNSSYGVSGVPYCAMFVSWCFNQAGASCAGLPAAYCPYIVSAGRNAGKAVSFSQAKFGDVVLFDWNNDGESDHVGLVESNNGSYLTTVEGNTGNGEVLRRTRAQNTVICILRPDYGVSANTDTPLLDIDVVAQQVINGQWGNGDERVRRLQEAGYDPAEVQRKVNEILSGDNDSDTYTPNVNNSDTLNGIDISSWQTGIDLSKVPCDFVIVKATGGISYVNPDCDRAYQQAKSLGKLLGFYHYAREASCKGSAIDEAKFFLEKTRKYFGEGIPVLDWEEELNLGVSWAKEWLDYVSQETGIKPVIYTSKSVCRSYDWSPVANAGYQLWCAQYANTNETGYQSNPWTDSNSFGAWSKPIIYQYSGTGKLDGYSGQLDLNIFYGNSALWQEIAGVKAEPQYRHDLQTWDFNGSAAQKFWMRVNSDGTVALRNVSNWLWLSDPNSETKPVPAQLWAGQGGDTGNQDPKEPQLFIIEKLNKSNEYGTVCKIHPKVAPNLSLDVNGASADSGAAVQWWKNNDTVAQEWIFYFTDGAYILINPAGMKALDAPNGGWL